MAEKLLVTHIQRFSLNDGPGIRTTVFFKGCSLRCPWCSNPENLTPFPEQYVKEGISGTYGYYLSCDELYDEIVKDKAFYGEGGGVTFSGGEALLQFAKAEPLLKVLKTENIHTAIESSLFASRRNLGIAVKYIDLFYVDVKILDAQRCRDIEQGVLGVYLSNLDVLMKSGKPVVFRIPVIGGYTDHKENRRKVLEMIRTYQPIKVELIKEHHLGESKYASLRMPTPNCRGTSDEVMETYKNEISPIGVPVEICRI